MCWLSRGLCALPVFLVCWSSCTFLVCYVVAVFEHDVDVIFPYISDTGAKPPESCIFGLMTFISAFAGSATIYARYKYVARLSEDIVAVSPCLNTGACVLGLVSIGGMCIVATFQEKTVPVVHYIGAFLFFFTGTLHIVLQSIISFHPLSCSATVRWARVGIACIGVVAFFPTVVCAALVKGAKREPGEESYNLSMASAVCEWITTFSFVFFFFTYITDFKLFTLRVTVSQRHDQAPELLENQEST